MNNDMILEGLQLTRYTYADKAHTRLVFTLDRSVHADANFEALSAIIRTVAREGVPEAKFSYYKGWYTQDDKTTEKVLAYLTKRGATVSEYARTEKPKRAAKVYTREDFLAALARK